MTAARSGQVDRAGESQNEVAPHLEDVIKSKLRFLVVEDEPGDVSILRSVLDKALGSEGYQLDAAQDRRAARAAMETNRFDVVFLDYDLGSESGFVFLRDLHKGDFSAPVIILTGKGAEEIAVEALRLGASDYLTKAELDASTLTRSLLRILTVASLRRAQYMAEARLAAAARGSQDAIVTKDLSGNILSWNLAAQHMFGWSAEEMLGKNITKIVPADKQEEWEQLMADVARGYTVSKPRTKRRKRDGAIIDVQLTVNPILDNAGVVVGAVGVTHDIGPMIALEQGLATRQQQLEIDNLLLKEFGHVVAHDLREPVRALMVRLDHLSQTSDDVDVREAMAAATRLRTMLDGFEVMAGLQQAGEVRELDIAEIVQDVLDGLSQQAAARGAEFEVGALPHMWGDPAQVYTILQNLIGNAIKYGGDPPRVAVTGRAAGGVGEIRIRDNGGGIPAPYRERIFQPFQRGAHFGDASGTGLGLFVASVMALRQGGHVRLEETSQEGSTFLLELPLP